MVFLSLSCGIVRGVQIQQSQRYGINTRSQRFAKFITHEDCSLPIAVRPQPRDIRVTLDNRAMMEVRQIQGKRVILTLSFEAATRVNGRASYRRLRERSVTLSIGSVAEAERAIDAVLAFAMSLDGKHLAANEIANPQANSSESASEPREP